MVNYIYIHIPFCETKCRYCAFCSYPFKGNILKYKDNYINALIDEIKAHYKGEKAKTIYFGGGTPSLLEGSDIKKILDNFNYDKNTQITLEINPSSSAREKLKEYKALGINRLSFGVQSFKDSFLSEIGRTHKSKDIYKSIENARSLGFDNISIDLIYGLPSQSLEDWQDELDEVLKLGIEHISLYGLKIEDGTYYSKFPPKNLPDLDMQADMYKTAIEKLKDKFIHYEFSNFASNEEYKSIHNLAYWKRENYYGFGLSASGFIGNKRYTNTFNFREYLKNPAKRNFETLTKEQELEEEIFLGLRLAEGINFSAINKKYDIDINQKYQSLFNKFVKEGFMRYTKEGLCLTLNGVLVSNEILCEFIQE